MGKHHASGVTCKLYYERYCNFSGTYKMLSQHGEDKVMEAIGEYILNQADKTDFSKGFLPFFQRPHP